MSATAIFIVGIVAMFVITNLFVLNNGQERQRIVLWSILLLLLFPRAFGANSAIWSIVPTALAHHSLCSSYRKENVPFRLTNCGIYLSVATLLWPPSVLLLPILLFNMGDIQSLSLRNLMAFLFGFLAPIFFTAALVYMLGWEMLWAEELQQICLWNPIWLLEPAHRIAPIISSLTLFALYLIGIGLNIFRNREKKVRIAQLMAMFMRPIFLAFGGLLFTQHLEGYCLLMLLPAAMLLASVISAPKVLHFVSAWLVVVILCVWSITYNLLTF